MRKQPLVSYNTESSHIFSYRRSANMTALQDVPPTVQNSISVWYSSRVQVKPCSADRVPQLSLEILYLIAKALPRPKWIYNLAQVNKHCWHYLQPALYQCEVTYETKLKEHFGIGYSIEPRDYVPHEWDGDEEGIQEFHRWLFTSPLCEQHEDHIAIER